MVVAVLAAAALLVATISLPLLVLSLAVLCVLLPPRRWWTVAPALAWVGLSLVQMAAGGMLVSTIVGWTLVLAGAFAVLSVLRPGWSATSRALAALGGSAAGVGLWLTATGGWGGLDRAARRYFGTLAAGWEERLSAPGTDPGVAEALRAATTGLVDQGVAMLPAMLALQLLLSLALAWWVFARLAAREGRWASPGPLRDFRFNDQLVWIVIAGLALLVLPLGAVTARAGANLLLFMGALYALRGIAVFLFIAHGRGPFLLVAFGALAALLFPPVALVPLLVGLGDTWLDIRRRVAVTSPA